MGRGNTSWEKRQREKQKRERKDAKRVRRDERRDGEGGEDQVEAASQEELMAKFAALSEQHAAGKLSAADFEEGRTAIFEQLGLEAATS